MWEESREKDSMIIQGNKSLRKITTRSLLLLWLLGCSCGQDLTDDPIPVVPFPDTTLNLSFPEYQKLAFDGGYKLIGTLGVRGVILYRNNSSTYLAFEVNCSYHPNEASANVSVHTSGLYMTCTGCGSNFSFTGQPTGGVAWRPLRKYRTELSGSNLTVTNEIVN